MDLTQIEMLNAVALTGSITGGGKSAPRSVQPDPSRVSVSLKPTSASSLFIRENQRQASSPAGHNFTLQPADPGAG